SKRLTLTKSLCRSCSRYQPICPTTSRRTPTATEKISSFCHGVSVLNIWITRKVSNAWPIDVTTYQRLQCFSRTRATASKLMSTSSTHSPTNDQWTLLVASRLSPISVAATKDRDKSVFADWNEAFANRLAAKRSSTAKR